MALAHHKVKLQGLDRFFWADLLFLKSVSGNEGLKKLEQLFAERCLPSAEKTLSLDAACTHANALLESDLYKFASAAAQGSLKAGVAVLESLKKGQAPLRQAKPEGFHAEIWSRIVFFFCIENPKAKTSAQGSREEPVPKFLMGVEALKHRWEEIKATPATKLQLCDLDPYQMYGHMLDPAWKKEVQVKQSELGKAVAKRVRGKKDVDRAVAKKPRVCQADAEGEKAARALLGM